MIGALLQNRYRLDAELGHGGMGTVYRAHDTLLDRDVAVKVLNDTGLGTEGRARLLREAQAVTKLNHPNIVAMYDAGEVEATPFIVMELVAGSSLRECPPSSLDETLIFKKSWEKLPPDLQKIVGSAARDASLYIMTREMMLNPPALQLFKDYGVNIITLSPEVQKKAKQLSEEVHAETAAQDPFFAKVLTSLNTFRKNWDTYKTAFTISYK